MSRGASPTSPARALAREREREAFELRKGGKTYEQIGDALGVTTAGAHKIVKRVLTDLIEKTSEDAAEVRRLEVERLDALLAGIWDKASGGDLWAVDRSLKIMERRAKLLGLDGVGEELPFFEGTITWSTRPPEEQPKPPEDQDTDGTP